jgi:CHAT domain-containing protein/tetratricopeptide (TPR) repeat protein
VFSRFFRSTPRLRGRSFQGLLFVLSLLGCLYLGQWSWNGHRATGLSVQAQAVQPAQTTTNQQVQQGVERYQAGDYAAAIELWQAALVTYQSAGDLKSTAIVLENLARAYQALGQTDAELRTWQQANQVYQQLNDLPQVGRMLTEQAQLYSRLGQYRNALALLCTPAGNPTCDADTALAIAQTAGDRQGEAAALGSLGDAHRLRGDYERAIDYLQSGLRLSQELNNPAYLLATYNSLGNAYLSLAQLNYRRALSSEQIEEYVEAEQFQQQGQSYDNEALQAFQQGDAVAQAQSDRLGQVRLQLSSVPPAYRTQGQPAGDRLLQQLLTAWPTLPDSQEKVYAAIDLARLLRLDPGAETTAAAIRCDTAISPQAETLLTQAVSIAQQLGNRRAESFALGELGHLYECQSQYPLALDLTRRAQWSADQALQARDSLYLWQWQAGRIFKAQDKQTEAIQAYEEAIATLSTIQDEIVIASREIRFDFRDTVEPLYRELVELRLDQEQPSSLITVVTDRKQNVYQALDTLDALKLAELQNYFGNDCVLTAVSGEVNLADTDPQAAVFSTAILDDRAAVIVSFRSREQPLQQQFEWITNEDGTDVSREVLIEEINQYRRSLERFRDALPGAALAGYRPEQSQRLYNWLIRPFVPLLENQGVSTLVFVQDGIFRSVPMAALYDGQQFLIERYAIATTPSLTLTDFQPAAQQSLRALAMGLTQSATVDGRVFPELAYVGSEIEAIKAALPNSLDLLNQDFTRDRLQQQLDARTYPIIHIATHGRFSAEAENAFLVTGRDPESGNQKLTINDLDDIIRQISLRSPVDLLVLSACQTAAGDDRAALGLAGIAAQAGAKSVLASLWSVNDPATTQLVTQFYEQLTNSEMTKAEALRSAQLSLIQSGGRTAHPAYWSAFVLIGNWL